jgi:hypothetical protein
MCTVSFIPLNGKVYITSNRDEKSRRKLAEPPDFYKVGGRTLLYPVDGEKGGTWIAATDNGNAAVLLNGGFVAHAPSIKYKGSRGLIISKVLVSKDAVATFRKLDLEETEPFTIIIYSKRRLFECRWDGTMKTVQKLSVNEPHIWSSSTLYSKQVADKRKQWFDCWMKHMPLPDEEEIISFHQFTGDGDTENDLVMNRNGETHTVSITSLCIDKRKAAMMYVDLVQAKRYRQQLTFYPGKFFNAERRKRLLIRLFHWEYWPFHIVYAPIYLYWLWLCVKARSFFFFNTANPTIKNGGFLMESKHEIYNLLPEGTYPETFLVRGGADILSLPELLKGYNFQFPLILKPDIGMRGLGVKKVCSIEGWQHYHAESKVDYLVQPFIPYNKEVGIFYYRLPGQKKGVVTGIVGKELLSVKGNGRDSLEQLLQKEARFLLQLPSLREQYGPGLSEIPGNNEERIIVPYGNHSRGAMFLDITDKLTPELFDTINNLCRSIPGFYYGRLDIKYDNWEDLCKGCNFSIIELNGSGSEPAHIYDPRHSLLFAWKEIIRHLRILYKVSRQNKKLKKLSYLSVMEGIKIIRENSAYMKKIS